VAVERDPRSIARARARVAEAGLRNVSFAQSMCTKSRAASLSMPLWLPDPVSVLRSVSQLVRPGGVVAFHEPYWVPVLSLLAPLPLWSATASLIHEAFQRSGANMELGPALYRAFQEAGLPAPIMRLEMLLGKDPDFAQWFYDIICTLRPRIQQLNLPLESLGNLETLPERLQAEVEASNTVASWLAPVGAWARRPSS